MIETPAMHTVLIDAILSSCSEHAVLLDSLSWPEDSWPETDRVYALAAVVEGIGKLVTRSDSCPVTQARKSCVLEKIDSVIWKKCLPLLSKISAEGRWSEARCRESTAAACRLLRACVAPCGEAAWSKAALSILPYLQPEQEKLTTAGQLSVEVAAECVACLAPFLVANDHLTRTTLSVCLTSIKSTTDSLLPKIIIRVIWTLLNRPEGSKVILGVVLEDMCSWYAAERTAVVTERALLCLTALSDHLLSAHSSLSGPDLRMNQLFWRIVQDGLTHKDNLTRKRAMHLLKGCVTLAEVDESSDHHRCPEPATERLLFCWSPDRSRELREFWWDYVLVMETLEENQIHVVRPVLNRIDSLIQTTVNENDGSGLIHPSWLLCVYQRMFDSENKSLTKEGVFHLLQLSVLQQPTFASAFSQFIVGPLLDALSESSLFCRSAGQRVGECPELAVQLQVFFSTFFSSLTHEGRGGVLLQLIQRLSSKHWSAVPLLFICQSLTKLPSEPLLGVSGLAAVREVLGGTLITHQVLLREAAQCFMLNSALCLISVSAITLDDFFSFLTCFRADESLCRGTALWNQLCFWLVENEDSFKPGGMRGDCTNVSTRKQTIEEHVRDEIQAYLEVPPSTGQSERLQDSREADKLARAILLQVDMQRSQARADISLLSSMDALLSPLLETLSRASTNMYQPLSKSDKSLQLMLALLHLGQRTGEDPEDEVLTAIKKQLLRVFNPVLDFIVRQLCGELCELCDVQRAELYLAVLQQLTLLCSSSSDLRSSIYQTALPKITRFGLSVLQNQTQQVSSVAEQVTRAVAMASLAAVCNMAPQERFAASPETTSALTELHSYFLSPTAHTPQETSLGRINQQLRKPEFTESSGDVGAQRLLQRDRGLIAANFMRNQWVCLNVLTKTFGVPRSLEVGKTEDTHKALLLLCIEALTLLPSDLVLPVLDLMETLLPELISAEEALCVQALTHCWDLVQGLSTNAHDFWLSLRGFISLAFQQRLLSLTEDQAPALTVTLNQIAVELLELSQTKSGVFGMLVQHCCHTWQTQTLLPSVFSLMDVLIEACVYGPVMRKDQRLIQDVHIYVAQLGDSCAANATNTNVERDDQLPRISALAFISHLDSSNQQHRRLTEELVMKLLQKDKSISLSKLRYHSNSLQHRVKNRVWQTLLLLLHKLQEEFVDLLLQQVFEAGFGSNHASVKYLIEWMMVMVLVRCPQHIEAFWSCFQKAHEHTKTSVCTFLAVLVHFNVILPLLKDKVMHLRKALDVTLQCCFSHNFSVRLYALLALKNLWSLAEKMADEAGTLGALSSVVSACLTQAEAMQSTGNANRNWIRIQEHFFFNSFHPIRDYSTETVFYIFPSLSELADDEWIPPWKFEKLAAFAGSSSFPLRNATRDLDQVQPGFWTQQDGQQGREERWVEVQKKITPVRLGLQEQELELQLGPALRAARLGKQQGELLVVASLIDKPTNLGGLCRTCEIFGANALVLDSLHHVADKHFQSLSVSSELWLPLLEVKPVELSEFLQAKKGEGYSIVGVEQTANSQSLQDYQFPEKTLLLLGNEREGIPANFLQMLDVCVEIPQLGVIRSLNVHVSAALLIWEYTRQHLDRDASKASSEHK